MPEIQLHRAAIVEGNMTRAVGTHCVWNWCVKTELANEVDDLKFVSESTQISFPGLRGYL